MSRIGRRMGYAIGVGVNLALFLVVLAVDDWDRVPFLTAEFEELVSLLLFSLAVSILANLAYLVFDHPVLHRIGEIGVGVIAIYVTARIYGVFPFEFSNRWGAPAVRTLLILAMIGAGIGVITQIGKLASGRAPSRKEAPHVHGV